MPIIHSSQVKCSGLTVRVVDQAPLSLLRVLFMRVGSYRYLSVSVDNASRDCYKGLL